MYHGVLFDVDDTLYSVSDVLKGQWQAHKDEIEKTGVSFTELIRVYDEVRISTPYSRILKETAKRLGRDDLAGVLREIADRGVPSDLPCYRGVRSMLSALKARGVKLGVISNGDKIRQVQKLEALGIRDLFDMVMVCDGQEHPFKPEEEAFKRASALLGVPVEKICMVGDRSDNDLEPAMKLGMGAIRIQLGNHKHQDDPCGALLSTSDPVAAWKMLGMMTTPVSAIPAPRRSSEEKVNAFK